MLAHAHPLEAHELGGNEGHVFTQGGIGTRTNVTEEPSRAVDGRTIAPEEAQEGGLARAVPAHQSNTRSRGDTQIEGAENEFRVAVGDAAQVHERRCRSASVHQ